MYLFFFLFILINVSAFNKESIDECSRVLSEYFKDTFKRVTVEDKIVNFYEKFLEAEQFDPRVELKRSKAAIEDYLQKRAEFAFKAKVSLESREVRNLSDAEVNDPQSHDFIRFMSAKQGNDATTIYGHDHSLTKIKVNETRNFTMSNNANFYNLATSSIASAVHIPTPIYDRNSELLRKIEWSDIDAVYRNHREETRDLAFQLFCSESGYMRFFPATSWYWENQEEHLDLFDCRNTQWYINAATNSKNVIIMLDLSGSMLGQRYEIAKQTIEAILETLSHNDYFNIMTFSKNAYFLDDCNGENGLLQATMRNKKALRNKMNNVSSEGKADYDIALPQAFDTLLNLSGKYSLHTKEDFTLLSSNQTDNKLQIVMQEHVLLAEKDYYEAVTTSYGRIQQGCENVIMLVTDGAPNSYKGFFDKANKEKQVRVFSFLIGEEAIDFEQVKEMACYNRGFMVHVQNMADVEEKVQYYIRTMSRPIGQHASDIGIEDALWSGVYREKLYLPRDDLFAEAVPTTNQSYSVLNKMASRRKIRIQKSEARGRMFVTTVSYPVIVNETFMGVAAVNIPLTEINQQAHPSNIGARSYFFMLDQNGFIMFHPQLRPINPDTKEHKQNYNNMALLELEVAQSQQVNRMVMECDNSHPQQLDVLFGSEMLDRVYPQTNTYYSECIEGSNFVLGLAVAKGDDYRLKARSKQYNYANVDLSWIEGKQWRVHPHWRYCLLNDTDSNMSKEEAFTVYANQMKRSGKLPELCKPRAHLVHKLLIDLEATSALQDVWDQQWQFLKDNLMHLIFFTAPSGMIRYYNTTLDDFDYQETNIFNIFVSKTYNLDNLNYRHYITDLNRKTYNDPYYQRAIRLKDTIVFDVSNKSRIWYKSETKLTAYGLNENETMLAQATKALYMGNALLGITGYEFAYDYVVNIMGEHGCPPSDDRRWCVLLDEHGYVFYSNQKDISYESYLKDPLLYGKHIGHWFGKINRVSQRAMELLVSNKFYTKLRYTDHQATCENQKVVTMSANIIQQPLRRIFNWLGVFLSNFLKLLQQCSLIPLYDWIVSPVNAYTASFHDKGEGFPCSKQSNFYLSNTNGRFRPTHSYLVDQNRSERPCTLNSKCSVKMMASFVEGTNLIMVWIHQDKSSDYCYDESQCPRLESSDVPFGFESSGTPSEEDTGECNGEPKIKPARSKAMCFNSSYEPMGSIPCSSIYQISTILTIIYSIILMILRV